MGKMATKATVSLYMGVGLSDRFLGKSVQTPSDHYIMWTKSTQLLGGHGDLPRLYHSGGARTSDNPHFLASLTPDRRQWDEAAPHERAAAMRIISSRPIRHNLAQ
jgi:hypothetical protein